MKVQGWWVAVAVAVLALGAAWALFGSGDAGSGSKPRAAASSPEVVGAASPEKAASKPHVQAVAPPDEIDEVAPSPGEDPLQADVVVAHKAVVHWKGVSTALRKAADEDPDIPPSLASRVDDLRERLAAFAKQPTADGWTQLETEQRKLADDLMKSPAGNAVQKDVNPVMEMLDVRDGKPKW